MRRKSNNFQHSEFGIEEREGGREGSGWGLVGKKRAETRKKRRSGLQDMFPYKKEE